MSKTTEHLLQQQEMKIEYQNKFMDFIYDNLVSSKLNEVEINDMERDSSEPLTAKSIIVSQLPLNSNNPNHIKAA